MAQYGPFELCDFWRLLTLEYLVACGSDPVTTTYSAAGDIAWDDPCGQLTVSPERIFRYTTFPAEISDPEYCHTGDIAVDLLITLVRCSPVLDDRGRPPAADALAAAHKGLLDDAQFIWAAVSDAAATNEREWERSNVAQTFVGSDGGAMACETRFTIGVAADQWCF